MEVEMAGVGIAWSLAVAVAPVVRNAVLELGQVRNILQAVVGNRRKQSAAATIVCCCCLGKKFPTGVYSLQTPPTTLRAGTIDGGAQLPHASQCM